MTIVSINETENPIRSRMIPIKEKQDIYIPNIVDKNIPNRNGMITVYTGSGGSGKTSLMLNMFQNKNRYRGKFDNIYYICPMASFLSVDKHPFEGHDKVYHELTLDVLEEIYQSLIKIKTDKEDIKQRNKDRKNKKGTDFHEEEEGDEVGEKEKELPIQYSCIIIDDFADTIKEVDIQRQLNKMLIKARHLCCAFCFTLQSYFMMPKLFRKQITNIIIFKPKNVEEWYTISSELMNLSKTDAMLVFNYIFNEPYAHLDIDTVLNKYYKNFNALEFLK